MRKKIVEFIAWLLGVSLNPKRQIHYIAAPRDTENIEVSVDVPDKMSTEFHKQELAKAIAAEIKDRTDAMVWVAIKTNPEDRKITLKGKLTYVRTR